MKSSIFLWQIIGFVVTVLGGVLLHFLYEWTNGALWIAPFSSVNESTWEHMKLLFFPMFIFAIVQSFFFKEYKNFWSIKLRGIALGLLLIPTIFYFYNGVIGKSPDWINIAIFVIAVAASYLYEIKLFKKSKVNDVSNKEPIFVLIVVAIAFVVFTYVTPELGIFVDPITNTYGVGK